MTSVAEIEQALHDHNIVFLLYVSNPAAAQINTFNRLASKYAFSFVHTNSKEVADHFQITEPWKAVLLRNFDEPKVDFSGSFIQENIFKFLDKYMFPRVMSFNTVTADKIFETNVPTLFTVHNGDSYSK